MQYSGMVPSDRWWPITHAIRAKNKKTATGCFRPPFFDFDFVAA
jgi:hypothetical protein